MHRKNLKQALNHELVFKNANIVIKFNQNPRLKPCIDVNTDRKKKEAKNDFEKDFFKLMNNEDFEKTMENVRKHRDIKLVITERKSNYLVSEPNFYVRKFFREHLLAIEMKKKSQRYL